MKEIIDEIIGKLKREIEEFTEERTHSLDEAEQYFTPKVNETITALL